MRACNVAVTPALEKLKVYCSNTSYIAARSSSYSLSNSSIQHTPRSLNSKAPGSIEKGVFFEARTAAAVKPAVDVPLPAT